MGGKLNGIESSVINNGAGNTNDIQYDFSGSGNLVDNSAQNLLGNTGNISAIQYPRAMYSQYKNYDGTPFKNPWIEYNHDKGLFGLENGTWNNLGQAAGLAGTVVTGYNQLLGNVAQDYKMKKAAMKQNMANIAEDRAAHKAFQGNFGSGINSAMGNGLAGSAVKA